MSLHNDGKSPTTAAISQPKIHANVMALPQTLHHRPTGKAGFGGRVRAGSIRDRRMGVMGGEVGKGMPGKGGMGVNWTRPSLGGNRRPWLHLHFNYLLIFLVTVLFLPGGL